MEKERDWSVVDDGKDVQELGRRCFSKRFDCCSPCP